MLPDLLGQLHQVSLLGTHYERKEVFGRDVTVLVLVDLVEQALEERVLAVVLVVQVLVAETGEERKTHLLLVV